MKGLGIDLAAIDRTAGLIQRFGERFTARVFTEAERDYCDRRPRPEASYAARFAAKEAVMKALGTGWGKGVTFKSIEVVQEEEGPSVKLHGKAAIKAQEIGIKEMRVSISHEGNMAAAAVIAA